MQINGIAVKFDSHEDILCLCRDTDNQSGIYFLPLQVIYSVIHDNAIIIVYI